MQSATEVAQSSAALPIEMRCCSYSRAAATTRRPSARVLEIFWRQGDTRVLESDAHVEAGAIRVRDHVRQYQAGMASAVRALQAAMIAPMAGPTESVASVSTQAVLQRVVVVVIGNFSLQ